MALFYCIEFPTITCIVLLRFPKWCPLPTVSTPLFHSSNTGHFTVSWIFRHASLSKVCTCSPSIWIFPFFQFFILMSSWRKNNIKLLWVLLLNLLWTFIKAEDSVMSPQNIFPRYKNCQLITCFTYIPFYFSGLTCQLFSRRCQASYSFIHICKCIHYSYSTLLKYIHPTIGNTHSFTCLFFSVSFTII